MRSVPRVIAFACVVAAVNGTGQMLRARQQTKTPPPTVKPEQTYAVPETKPGEVLRVSGFYHTASCSVVKRYQSTPIHIHDALKQGLIACAVCNPNQEPSVKAILDVDRETERVRLEAAAAAERAIAKEAADRDAAERKRIESDRAKAAEAERVRLATAPVLRASGADSQAAAEAAAAKADNTESVFRAAFRRLIQAKAPEYSGPLTVHETDALKIFVSGPVALFEIKAAERVRKFEPLGKVAWQDNVLILVAPSMIDSPDIERVVLQRNGVTVPPISSTLVAHELVSRMGAKALIHSGEIYYPLSAFAPGQTVKLTAVPASGTNIVKVFTDAELRRIQ